MRTFSRRISSVTSLQSGTLESQRIQPHRVCLYLLPSSELLKTSKFDFRVSLQEPLACLLNQTLLCLVSQPACLPACLAGWLQRGPKRDNRRKEKLHMHTNTHTFPTLADDFNSSFSFVANLFGNPLWMDAFSVFKLFFFGMSYNSFWFVRRKVLKEKEKKSEQQH